MLVLSSSLRNRKQEFLGFILPNIIIIAIIQVCSRNNWGGHGFYKTWSKTVLLQSGSFTCAFFFYIVYLIILVRFLHCNQFTLDVKLVVTPVRITHAVVLSLILTPFKAPLYSWTAKRIKINFAPGNWLMRMASYLETKY